MPAEPAAHPGDHLAVPVAPQLWPVFVRGSGSGLGFGLLVRHTYMVTGGRYGWEPGRPWPVPDFAAADSGGHP
ncbi:hypothetical protein GCM10009612_23010 [Streptomyces beijiangensis]